MRTKRFATGLGTPSGQSVDEPLSVGAHRQPVVGRIEVVDAPAKALAGADGEVDLEAVGRSAAGVRTTGCLVEQSRRPIDGRERPYSSGPVEKGPELADGDRPVAVLTN